MIEIVTVGGINIDCVVNAEGAVACDQMGGNAVYSAVAARLWNDHVGIAGCVPRNYPAALLDRLRQGGIATDGIAMADEEVDLQEWFFYRPDGSRVDHLLAPAGAFAAAGLRAPLDAGAAQRWQAALAAMRPCGIGYGAFRRSHPVAALPEAYRGLAGLHLAPFAALEQTKLADATSACITLDPSPTLLAGPREQLIALLRRVAAFLPSEKELRMIVDAPPAVALAQLAELAPAILGVKLGAAGSLIWDRDARRTIAVPAVATTVRDPTGAGDAWCGGFLAGLVAGEGPVEAACRGTVAASFAVEGFGALHALNASRAAAQARLRDLRARVLP